MKTEITVSPSEELAQLDAAEAAQLTRFEERIQEGLASFIEVGEALSAIRERRLYRATHGTFEEYCRVKWGMSRVQAHRLIVSAETVEALPIGNREHITTEFQARELAAVPAPDRAAVVEKAIQATGGKITAKAIREAAKPEEPEVVTVDTPEELPVKLDAWPIKKREISEKAKEMGLKAERDTERVWQAKTLLLKLNKAEWLCIVTWIAENNKKQKHEY